MQTVQIVQTVQTVQTYRRSVTFLKEQIQTSNKYLSSIQVPIYKKNQPTHHHTPTPYYTTRHTYPTHTPTHITFYSPNIMHSQHHTCPTPYPPNIIPALHYNCPTPYLTDTIITQHHTQNKNYTHLIPHLPITIAAQYQTDALL